MNPNNSNSGNSNSNPNNSNPTSLVLSKGIITIGIIATLCSGVYFIVDKGGEITKYVAQEGKEATKYLANKAESVADKAGSALKSIAKNVFKTKDNSNTTIFTVGADKSAGNLITLERRFEHQYEYSTSWMGSDKKFVVRAQFRAFAGINYKNNIDICIPKDRDIPITAHGLHGELFACEMIPDTFVIVDEDAGLWNRINNVDREVAMNQLNNEARRLIDTSDLKYQAEENFLQFIENKARDKKQFSREADTNKLLLD
ncbi:MAG: hypothetical protein RR808_04795 [Akkermansia sp.]